MRFVWLEASVIVVYNVIKFWFIRNDMVLGLDRLQ